jgi:uncharacterized protein YkwD
MKARPLAPTLHFPAPLLILLMMAALTIIAIPDGAAGQTVLDLGAVMVPTNMAMTQTVFVPDAESALLHLLNQTRRQHGLSPLVTNSVLRMAARSHSREMALGGFIGHGSPSSGSFLNRLSAFLRPGVFVGENVTCAVTVNQVETAFEASPGHLENILEPRFRSVGIGIATGALGLLVTEDFAE